MPAKPVFNDEQFEMLHNAALRVWKKFQRDGKKQAELARALGISQQSVSNLIKGTYRPGVRVANEIAILDNKELEDLVGAIEEPERPASTRDVAAHPGLQSTPRGGFKNLDLCVQFFANTRSWSPWTVAAAHAGFFGNSDFAPPEWATKLDSLEKTMEKARKS